MSPVLVPGEVDPRGLRFAAALTAVVLTVVLVTESAVLLAAQTLVFAIGAFWGVRRSPYGVLFAKAVRPQLGPPSHTEDARPPQFAQGVGFAFALVGAIALVASLQTVGLIAVGLALVAAFLNAVFGLCLGCEVYLLIIRNSPARSRAGVPTTEVTA